MSPSATMAAPAPSLPRPRVFVNLRDLTTAMGITGSPAYRRVLTLAAALGSLPRSIRPEGIMFEDPTSETLPWRMSEMVSEVCCGG